MFVIVEDVGSVPEHRNTKEMYNRSLFWATHFQFGPKKWGGLYHMSIFM